MTTEQLREKLHQVFKNENFDTLDTDFTKYRIKEGLGFFPYGSGLLEENEQIPLNGILILGKDFGTIKYFEGVKDKGEQEKPTLKNLLRVIENPVRKKFFLSNVFMGLRKQESNTTEFPELLNVKYLSLCKEFLEIQIEGVKPKAIIT